MIVEVERIVPVAPDLHFRGGGTINGAQRRAHHVGELRGERGFLNRSNRLPLARKTFDVRDCERGTPPNLFEHLEIAVIVLTAVRAADDCAINRVAGEERNHHPRARLRGFVERTAP